MFVKYFFISFYTVLLFDIIVKATHIPAFKCMQVGWGLCNIREVEISPADRVIEDRSCFVDRGSNVTVAFNFTPRFQSYNLKWSIWVETVIGDYRVEGVPEDARNFTNYPTIENKLNEFKTVIHVPDDVRAKFWVVRVTITGDSDKDICCFLCEVRVRKPITTAVSSTVFDPTNPYDIVRKKFSNPTIWDFNQAVKTFQNDSNVFNKFVFDNSLTPSRFSYLSIIKNAFKRFFSFGTRSEMTVTEKIPFLGNASSFVEYMNNVIGNCSSTNETNIQTVCDESETGAVNVGPTEFTNEIITTEETTPDISTVQPSTLVTETTTKKNIDSNILDSDRENARDEAETGNEENSVKQTTTSTLKTTRIKTKAIRSLAASKKGIAKSRLLKASRAGIRKTVKPIAKSKITLAEQPFNS